VRLTVDDPVVPSTPRQDVQTVTPDGVATHQQIAGVRIRPAVTQMDDRGSVCEVYSPAWGFTDEPLVYVYQVTIRPGEVKGWVVHREQDDRLFFSSGDVKVVLYDDRSDSPTFEQLDVLYFGESRRALLRIPRGVYHAVQNVGLKDALFINCPTAPYRHDKPDKLRLSLENDLIPYRF
jgi:dTDP-4-dehydrorhamnose 3,5-epimerase